MPRRTTRMKRFGTSSRESHNSETFYSRALYNQSGKSEGKGPDTAEQAVPASCLDAIFCQDSRSMHQLPDASVHLMVTSPPYNVGKEYDADLSPNEYRSLLCDVFRETHRVLVPGGRACVNVANLGRKPYLPLHALVIDIMREAGFLMRGEIIWDKSASAGVSTAWGSWKSASNPTLRDVHEYILIFSKSSFQRAGKHRKNTITKEQFLDYTKSIWSFPAESARKVGHPAPFPVELPARLIQLYTFAGDVVLDPFCGSGTTCVAAREAGRYFVGYDCAEEYVKIARERASAKQS